MKKSTICHQCGKIFKRENYRFKQNKTGVFFCSQKCYLLSPKKKEWSRDGQLGRKQSPKQISKRINTIRERYGERKMEKSVNWKGGRWKDTSGYIRIKMPNHPSADCKGYVIEHRYVMEQKLGKILKRYEQVHHINGIRDDNRIENLEVVQREKHYGRVCCPKCSFEFLIK